MFNCSERKMIKIMWIAMAESDVARLEMEKAASAEPRTCCGSTRSHTAADEMAEQRHQPDQSVQRVTIKFFYELLGSPPEEDWDQRDGTIAWIRRLMVPKELGSRLGGTAPWPATVRRTLVRLQNGDDDIAARSPFLQVSADFGSWVVIFASGPCHVVSSPSI